MFFSRWPSLMLTVAMLIVVGICLKRIDFLLIDEVKAVISIAFGFATSCLLLSLIWIIHRKPMHATWPAVANVAIIDAPNMHPRASIVSNELPHYHRRTTADACRLAHDQPPDYENALINSKPISWIVALNREDEKSRADQLLSDSSAKLEHDSSDMNAGRDPETTRVDILGCHLHNHQDEQTISSTNEPDKISSPTAAATTTTTTTSDNMTQLALSIVRGFTSVSNNNTATNLHQQTATTGDDSSTDGEAENLHHQHQRKVSFCRLDVNQLMDQGSPPKYCEITMLRADQAMTNQNTEPTAGSSPPADV